MLIFLALIGIIMYLTNTLTVFWLWTLITLGAIPLIIALIAAIGETQHANKKAKREYQTQKDSAEESNARRARYRADVEAGRKPDITKLDNLFNSF